MWKKDGRVGWCSLCFPLAENDTIKLEYNTGRNKTTVWQQGSCTGKSYKASKNCSGCKEGQKIAGAAILLSLRKTSYLLSWANIENKTISISSSIQRTFIRIGNNVAACSFAHLLTRLNARLLLRKHWVIWHKIARFPAKKTQQ